MQQPFYNEMSANYRQFDPARFSPPVLDDPPRQQQQPQQTAQAMQQQRSQFPFQNGQQQQVHGPQELTSNIAQWQPMKDEAMWDGAKNNNWNQQGGEKKMWQNGVVGFEQSRWMQMQQQQQQLRQQQHRKETWHGSVHPQISPLAANPSSSTLPATPPMREMAAFVAPSQPFQMYNQRQSQDFSHVNGFEQQPQQPQRKFSTIQTNPIDQCMDEAVPAEELNPTFNPMEISPPVQQQMQQMTMRPNCLDLEHKTSKDDGAESASSPSHKLSLRLQLRKTSVMATKSHLRIPRVCDSGAAAYTPPPILSPMRNGSGLFWQFAKLSQHVTSACSDAASSLLPATNGFSGDHQMEASSSSSVAPTPEQRSVSTPSDGAEEMVGPTRKNGFFYLSNQHNQMNFAKELEALRKDSWASTSSGRSKISISDDRADLRKASSVSEAYYDVTGGPQQTDANPHINVGKEFQARVKRWADQEVTQEDRDLIEDRDELLFDSKLIDHLTHDQLEAYELLACSQAVPRPGRNKEFALHLLMENKGNLEAAVMDLLRSDTLDWEQYRSVYDYYYPDSTPWTPEEILSFQDALYKTEKDFHQVAKELTNKSVKECVEFYYTWKKACSDDYRKLRNLRRKRQLLEIHQQVASLGEARKFQMESSRPECPIPPKQRKLSSDEVDTSEIEGSECDTDATSPGFSMAENQESRSRVNSFLVDTSPNSARLTPTRKTSNHAVSGSTPQHGHLGLSPNPTLKDIAIMQGSFIPSPRQHNSVSVVSKKGAQPSADGFFHCRLCDKCFEKVKSLNAHMKSHAMKARAEAEAQAQVNAAQLAQQNAMQQQQQNILQNRPGLGMSTQAGISAGLSTTSASALLPMNLAQNLQQIQQNVLLQQAQSPLNLQASSNLQAIVEQQLGFNSHNFTSPAASLSLPFPAIIQ